MLIFGCSSFAIPKSKQILKLKYQASHQRCLKYQELQAGSLLYVEKIKQHMLKDWIMVETGKPQFMLASSATTHSSGVICDIYSSIYD